MEYLIHEFILLWAVIDPIGTVPVFIAVTASMGASQSRGTAFKAVLIAAIVLLFFVVAKWLYLLKPNLYFDYYNLVVVWLRRRG